MSASVDISKFLDGLKKAGEKKRAAAIKALDIAGEQIIGDAQQLTPVKTGALQASGTTEPAKDDGSSIMKTIGFNTNYAAAVHERLDQKHSIGQAKFLSTAMTQDAAKVLKYVADQVAAVES
jgi:hypothetical protein